jgi:hypothetical protein
MKVFNEAVRRITTFLMASFLWVHALLFLNLQSSTLVRVTHLLRLTSSEAVLFALLILFSLLAASGLWGMVKSFAYIYFFPFILLAYFIYLCILTAKAIDRWFKSEAAKYSDEAVPKPPTIIEVPAKPAEQAKGQQKPVKTPGFWQFISRPFRRFLPLWCILLLITTHDLIVWACLFVVAVQLAGRIFRILKTVFFFDLWLKKFWENVAKTVNAGLIALVAVSSDSPHTKETEQLWNQVKLWKKICEFLGNPSSIASWSKVLGVLAFGSIYVYISVLFSFVYYGLAHVGGAKLEWPDALTISIFIPFYVTDLPKLLLMRMLGGLQCALVVFVGVGTVMNFLRNRLEGIRASAAEINSRFAEQDVREKYRLLETRYSNAKQEASPANAVK